MSATPDDLVDADGLPDRLALARLEEDRQAVATAELARESEPLAGGTMAFDGPDSWANQAAGQGLHGPVTDAELERLVAFYVERGHEPRIEVASVADESLHAGLAARGFVLAEWEHVLARVLTPNETLAAPPVEGLELERLDPSDDAAVRRWALLSMSGFYPEGEAPPEAAVALGEACARHPRSTSFVARLNGTPVGAAGLEVRGSAAALFATSVLPAARRRGVQRALIAARLAHARAHGARLACIHSRPNIPTERNALRAGFFLAYPKAVLVKRGEGLRASP